MLRAIALAFAALLFATAAVAADHGIYLGAGISQARVNVDTNSPSLPIDGSDTKYKVIVGVRPLNWLALEMNYIDFGNISNANGDFKLKGVDVTALGLLEFTVIDLYAKVGFVRWNSDLQVGSLLSTSESGNDPAYGGGVQVHFGSLSARAEYEKFSIQHADTDMVTVGVTWTFL